MAVVLLPWNTIEAEAQQQIPATYKDIDGVIENAKELVEVKYVLRQFVNVRGD